MTRRRRPRTAQERVVGVLGTVAPGSLGGRIRNTRPASVLQPNTGGPPATGFDPDADPIVIGSLAGATSPGGVVVGKNGLSSAADAIAIGENSAAISDSAIAVGASAGGQGLSAIAIGGSALVQGPGGTDADYGIAIGQGAKALVTRAVAIGAFAEVDGTRSTAVGYNSNTLNDLASAFGYGAFCDDFANETALGASTAVRAFEGTAMGYSAQANHTNATAIGAHAQTGAAHQIMLGTINEFVEIRGAGLVLYDTATSTRYLVQITSGALVLNTAP